MKRPLIVIFITLVMTLITAGAMWFLEEETSNETLTQNGIFISKSVNAILAADNQFLEKGIARADTIKKLNDLNISLHKSEESGQRFQIIRGFQLVYDSETGAANQTLNRGSFQQKPLYDIQVRLKRFFYNNQKILRYKPDFVIDYDKKPFNEIETVITQDKFELSAPLYYQPGPVKENSNDSYKVFTGAFIYEQQNKNAANVQIFWLMLLAGLVMAVLVIEGFLAKAVDNEKYPSWGIVLRLILLLIIATALPLYLQGSGMVDQSAGYLADKAAALEQGGFIENMQQISYNKHNLPVEMFTESKNISAEYLSKRTAQIAYFVFLLSVVFFVFVTPAFKGLLSGKVQKALRENRIAYRYITPAVLATVVVIFVPFIYSIGLGFFRELYNEFYFAWFYNYLKILFNFHLQPRAFYYTLGVTVLWTALNITLHVSIGLGLAMILKNEKLRFKGVYRALLILPWAVPNYITALIWKGMFHKQFGMVNKFLDVFGVEPISWFSQFHTSFLANLITNTWLGFPFMMVIALGALQSIPADLYEAADIDGASAFQKFRKITIPLLKPAMFPAIILGTIWTFNMFNIIYLVSNGAPNNSTDILIVEAYRWAFENDLYAYASAYSMIIFVILLLYSTVTNKMTKATEGV